MTAPFLTVLTTPALPGARRVYQRTRRLLRPLVTADPPPVPHPYPGHHAVTRSVVEGLRAIGADFNYNPRSINWIGRVVYAPANEALCQAMELKNRGRIDYLVAGPVNCLFPSSLGGILQRPEIDRLLVASEWILGIYQAEAPELVGKTRICPAGVDANWWSPAAARSNRVVVYWKSGDAAFCSEVERAVARRGAEPVRIRYGGYTPADFRAALDGAGAAVFLSSFETQGLALAEAWSMDVPTAVWNPRGRAECEGRSFRSGSSCPYLTGATGVEWSSLAALDAALDRLLQERAAFQPRRWVLEHMTDAVCARALLETIRDGALAGAGAR